MPFIIKHNAYQKIASVFRYSFCDNLVITCFKRISLCQVCRLKNLISLFLEFLDRLKAIADVVKTSVFIGRKGKLKCAVEGSPPPKIMWFKDGIQVKNSNKTSVKDRTFDLVIKDFQKSDEGKYTCFAENIANKVNMSIIVTAKVKQVIKPPETVTISKNVKNGMNLTLSCRAPADQVKLMQWHIPHYTPRPDTAGRSVFRDLGRDFERAREVLKPFVINTSRVETFKVYNISKKLHEGTYKCLVLYKSRKTPYAVKIVHVNFVEGNNFYYLVLNTALFLKCIPPAKKIREAERTALVAIFQMFQGS